MKYRTLPQIRPSETGLWFGDNGRITCPSPRCAGQTARYGGFDLSGQPMLPISLEEATTALQEFQCETCGHKARRIKTPHQ